MTMVEGPDGWNGDRGPLGVLPDLLFRARRPVPAILVAWLLGLGGSMVLGVALAAVAPEGAGPEFGQAPAWVLLVGIALVSPVLETLLMAGGLELLLRRLRPWQAVVASAAAWGVLHSLMAPLWGAVIWWPFLIFSTMYVTWRVRGFRIAATVAAAVHVLQNTGPAVATVLGF